MSLRIELVMRYLYPKEKWFVENINYISQRNSIFFIYSYGGNLVQLALVHK